MSALRILHVTPAFAPAYVYGGPITCVEGLVVELARSGENVRVLTTDAGGTKRLDVPRGWTTWRGVPVRYERRVRAPDLAPGILWQAPRIIAEADVVHVTAVFSAPSVAAMLAAVSAQKPVLLSPHGALQPDPLTRGAKVAKRGFLATLGHIMRRIPLHATSEAEADAIRTVLGARTRVVIVPNGVELEDATRLRANRDAVVRDPSRPRIGALGRIHPIKGLDRLVEATALLRDRGIRCDLELAGPSEDREHERALRHRIADVGLNASVSFSGELRGAQKDAFLARCDVLCLPSHSENFANVVVEALGAFVPVVAATGTPWAELVTTGAGRWVPNDPPSLAEALASLLGAKASRQGAGVAGRALVESKYTWRAIAEQFREVYASLRLRTRDTYS